MSRSKTWKLRNQRKKVLADYIVMKLENWYCISFLGLSNKDKSGVILAALIYNIKMKPTFIIHIKASYYFNTFYTFGKFYDLKSGMFGLGKVYG